MIGKFMATVSDYGLMESKNGSLQTWVEFSFDHEGAKKNLTWYGSFTGGAKEITLKALVIMGLNSNYFNNLMPFNDGPQSNALNIGKLYEIDVQEEPDQNGKMQTRVKWINDPENPTHLKKRLDQAGLAKFAPGMNFGGDLIAIAQEIGLKQQPNAQAIKQVQDNHYQQQGFAQNPPPQNNHYQAPPQNGNYQNQAPPQQNNYQAPPQQQNFQQQPANQQGGAYKAPF